MILPVSSVPKLFVIVTIEIPRFEPSTVFCVMGCANIGRSRLRLLSVFAEMSD